MDAQGDRILHARGLRQGDPLSPMLFVVVMEVLNAMISEAYQQGLLSPLPGTVMKHRLSIYADDLLMFVMPRQEDFTCIREVLNLFAGASGLITNIDKCSISPIPFMWLWAMDPRRDSGRPRGCPMDQSSRWLRICLQR